MFKHRFNTFGWAFADQALVSGMNFLTGLLLARFLGPEQFGLFSMAWVFVLLSNSVQAAMITSPMMNIGPKQLDEESPGYYGSVFVLQAILGLMFFIVLLIGIKVGDIFKPDLAVDRFVFALPFAAIFFLGQDFIRRYFFTIGKPFAAFISDLVSYCGQVVTILVLFKLFKFDVTAALWVCGVTSLLGMVVALPFLGNITFRIEGLKDIAKRHWQFSKWLVGSAALVWTTGNTLLITAAAVLGAASVGYLRAAQNLFAVTQVVFLALNNVLPRQAASRFHHGGRNDLIRYLKKSTWVCFLFTFPVVVLLALVPEFWLSLVYGQRFTGYGYIFKWLALSYLLTSLTLPLQVGLGAIEFTHPFFWTSMTTAFISLVLSVPLVNALGLYGVLFGMIFNQVVAGTILLYLLWMKLKSISPNLPINNK